MPENSDLYKKHRAWINYSKAYHDKHFKEEAKRFYNYFGNKFPKVTENDELQIYFNYYNMNVKRILPQLAPLNVTFNLRPKGGDVIGVGGQEFDNKRAVMIEEE